MATAWWKDKRQMEKQKQLTWGVIIILSSHLWRAKGLISILKLSAAVLDSVCPPQGCQGEQMPGELWCTTTNPSSDIAISVMDDTREKIRLHFEKKKWICIHMLMFSLSFYLPLPLYYEPWSVSRVISAYACSSVPAPCTDICGCVCRDH